MNSGDWMGSMSALFEDHEGLWHIEHYAKYFAVRTEEVDIQPLNVPFDDQNEELDLIKESCVSSVLRKLAFGRKFPNIESTQP